MIIRKLKELIQQIDIALMKRLRNRYYVIFNGSCAMNFTNFKPIYDQLILDENIVVYVMNSDRNENFYTQFNVPPERFITKRMAQWKKWDLCITTDFYNVKYKRQLKNIFISHGVSQKKSFDSDKAFMGGEKLLCFDKVFFSSKQLHDDFILELGSRASQRAVLCGYPRFDQLIQKTSSKEAICYQLGITDQRPIILFTPTWGEFGALNGFGEQIIQSLAELDAHILIKLHDHAFSTKYSRKNRIDWSKHLDSYKDTDNVYDIRYGDPYPYMQASDLMVADYGSIVLEYQLLKKPTVFLSLQKHNNSVVNNKALLTLIERASVTISNPDEIKDAVTKGLNEQQFSDNKAKMELCNTYFLNVGKATNILLTNIKTLLNKE